VASLLLVEDEPLLRRGLADTLVDEGHAVQTAGSAEEAWSRIDPRAPFDLVLLDVMLPGEDGLSLLARLRQHGLWMPVILLSVRAEEVDKVRGFRAGADDYVVKPFGVMELIERIRVALRRGAGAGSAPAVPTSPARKDVLVAGALEVHLRKFEARLGGETLVLTRKEFLVLRTLIQRRGDVVTRDELLAEVWGYERMPETRTLDTHVQRLRQKLGDDPEQPRFIRTVKGVGYTFPGEDSAKT
jgi:two-component system alkaline phosphatase synthesis response regulator PhoP